MFEEGNIVYFTPFHFKNGNLSKNKFFVVLKNVRNKMIVASLPTSKNRIPQKDKVENGCVELPDINFNCFVLSENLELTKSGKKFDVETFIYGHQIDNYEIEFLEESYPTENTDYIIWGKMKDDIFNDLIECLRFSDSIKGKYRKYLV